MEKNQFSFTRRSLQVKSQNYTIFSLEELQKSGITQLDSLPYAIRILLEATLRKFNDKDITEQAVRDLANWQPNSTNRAAMSFFPGRILLQDLTGVPVIVDLASLRSAMARMGGDPSKINPSIPVDLVIDHSVHVDYFGSPDSLKLNTEMEFKRNGERYGFLHWAQNAFNNFRVVPPATGIVHQINLEYLTQVVLTREVNGEMFAFPDTLVGTDSHTTMVNGLGVVGWGVGGIEAIAGMLNQPLEMRIPDVIGFKLTGRLPEGTTPTDLTLTITQILRSKGVVDKFVEFYGQGLNNLSLADRAMIANMSPENGATITYFPVDEQTLDYLRLTGRSEELINLVETYFKAQHLFRQDSDPVPAYSDTLELDISTIEPSLAGPKRPQDRVTLNQVKPSFRHALLAPKSERGFGLLKTDLEKSINLEINGRQTTLHHGAVVLASITSCTNTSNPFVLITAGLLAQKAVEKGLKVKPYVKTSFAPGSRVVVSYLEKAGLTKALDKLGFNLVGFGCATCIGNSGPLPKPVSDAIAEGSLVASAVLSGNRNFEGRVHAAVQANYLASPPLVVAYALAGTVNIDLANDPLGESKDGTPVYLRDIWPSHDEITRTIMQTVKPELFKKSYAEVYSGSENWNQIHSPSNSLYEWQPTSTYIQELPFFEGTSKQTSGIANIDNAQALAVFGDSITTDHISPAGSIPANSPAGLYLQEKGVPVSEFNSYGSRRGNDRVMVRGTFANIRLKNRMLAGVEGGYTLHLPDKTQMTIYDASVRYQAEGVPLIILAGKEYGTGSSRDWAAKGPRLLGVRAVIAESFERIHRSNLAGMGVLPLQFLPGDSVETLKLTGTEVFSITGMEHGLKPGMQLTVTTTDGNCGMKTFPVIARLNTETEIEYIRNGGILPTVLLNLLD